MSLVPAPFRGHTVGTYLERSEPFPADLTELSVVELQVLPSRVCRQLDREYLTGPEGPHPLTLERHRELSIELDAREWAR